jgi:phosphomethylpyrimidine synthase
MIADPKTSFEPHSSEQLPASRRVYVEGKLHPKVRVPMREITQSDTPSMFGGERNPPVFVYDCSGPYSDPAAKIDIRSGLPALREPWILARNDTELLREPSSSFGKERLADLDVAAIGH